MEIMLVPFEKQLTLIINNKTVQLTPFLTSEREVIKIGIEAPYGLAINREEIYYKKKAANQIPKTCQGDIDHPKLMQKLFAQILVLENKLELLEDAAQVLFDKSNPLTSKRLFSIAQGEKSCSLWMVACVIDVLLDETPLAIKNSLKAHEVYELWAKPLFHRAIEPSILLEKVKPLKQKKLIELIKNHSAE